MFASIIRMQTSECSIALMERKRIENALRESEKRTKLLLENSNDLFLIIDEKGQVADGDQIMALLAGRWAEQGRRFFVNARMDF